MKNAANILLDIGNSRIKWGQYAAGGLRRTGSSSHIDVSNDGFEPLMRRWPANVDRVVASNVAGAAVGQRIGEAIFNQFGVAIEFVRCTRRARGVTHSYQQVEKMGVDRWVAMIGAYAEVGAALCVVDAGTAVTIDVLDNNGRHMGGQIMPGIELMGRALRTDTSNIVATSTATRDPGNGMRAFAKYTDAAVRYGAVTAVCGGIERAVRMQRSVGARPRIVLTGGDGKRILRQLNMAVRHRPHLVLQGLAEMTQ